MPNVQEMQAKIKGSKVYSDKFVKRAAARENIQCRVAQSSVDSSRALLLISIFG